jgi:hypothetical protein
VSRHQDRIEIRPLTGKSDDQVHTGITTLREVVLLHWAELSQSLLQQAAHCQQAEFVPAGVTRPGDALQISK